MGRHSGTVRRAFCRNGVMMAWAAARTPLPNGRGAGVRAAAAGQKAEQAPPRRAVPHPVAPSGATRPPPSRGQALSRSGTAFTLKVGGAHLLPPPARRSRVAGRADSGAAPSGVGGASPRRFVDDPAAAVDGRPGPTTASSSSASRLAQPPPTPTPPRHSASPSGGREEREAGLCESASPFGRGSRPARAGADPAHHDDGVMRIMPAPLGWIARVQVRR